MSLSTLGGLEIDAEVPENPDSRRFLQRAITQHSSNEELLAHSLYDSQFTSVHRCQWPFVWGRDDVQHRRRAGRKNVPLEKLLCHLIKMDFIHRKNNQDLIKGTYS